MSDNNSQATSGQFEVERDGQVSYLAYETDGHGWNRRVDDRGVELLHEQGCRDQPRQIAFDRGSIHSGFGGGGEVPPKSDPTARKRFTAAHQSPDVPFSRVRRKLFDSVAIADTLGDSLSPCARGPG